MKLGCIKKQQGSSLIEVMIAVVVVAVGLLGVAAMQLASLKNNQSAMERSNAVTLSYSILDRMRANRDVAAGGGYDHSLPGAVGACNATGGSGLAAADLAAWQQEINAVFGGGVACGAVDCDANFNCTITIEWDDSLATEGNAAQRLVTEAQL
jgi:type IV pilus assembly protein PilV